MIPEIVITSMPTMHCAHLDILVLVRIPEENKTFQRSWSVVGTTTDKFSLYKEVCHLISTSFADIIKDITHYEKYGIR